MRYNVQDLKYMRIFVPVRSLTQSVINVLLENEIRFDVTDDTSVPDTLHIMQGEEVPIALV